MKKLLFILLTFISISFTAYSQEEIKTNKENKELPEIFFEKTVHDYGTIKYESDGTCEFTFKNTGKEPLLLTQVQASCGCTTPTWPKEPVKPGETGTIVVKYNTKIPGVFSKSVRVYSNAKTNLVTLTIKGSVENKVN
ncbi:MAG: hypothetical protein A2W99_08870 [Bacteroidetes bacterium GWF2_33_16]|nr:MAG: hypothetical protein A2X00_00285 [Bacteroidetes bacterium GWE2_32_14]OFY05610.1 MAG: hypothetical protein A2W99_08870 [Bacteroidetes bacterium GWF2_33_16]